tara:strand:+ start:99 stop:365 length:267 start_codon:yes stop_codon:yes gene_type:complete
VENPEEQICFELYHQFSSYPIPHGCKIVLAKIFGHTNLSKENCVEINPLTTNYRMPVLLCLDDHANTVPHAEGLGLPALDVNQITDLH